MKKIIFLFLIFFGFSNTISAQKEKYAQLEKQIIALDRSGWEAWKNKNADWYKKNATEEFLSITADGVSNRAQVIKSTPVDCNVRSYSLDDFQFVVLNETAVLLTYIATQDGECGGKKLAAKVRASVNYVKRKGRWLEAFYMETPVSQ